MWLAASYVEEKAASQEGVKKYHLCLSVLSKLRAQSPDKFMGVTSDVVMIDEDGYLSRNMTIRTSLNDDSQLHDEHVNAVREKPNYTLTPPARCHKRETQW